MISFIIGTILPSPPAVFIVFAAAMWMWFGGRVKNLLLYIGIIKV
jgi:hypothetical protein